MIKHLYDYDIPTFPETAECDVWMLHIRGKQSIAEMMDNEIYEIDHINNWSIEGDGCSEYAIHVDRYIQISKGKGYAKLDFQEPAEINISYFVDTFEDTILISVDPEELKSVAYALYLVVNMRNRGITGTGTGVSNNE